MVMMSTKMSKRSINLSCVHVQNIETSDLSPCSSVKCVMIIFEMTQLGTVY